MYFSWPGIADYILWTLPVSGSLLFRFFFFLVPFFSFFSQRPVPQKLTHPVVCPALHML